MKITEMLGTPVHDAADVYFPEEKACSAPAPMPPQQSTDRRPRGIYVALGLAVAAIIGLAAGFYLSPRSAATPPLPSGTTTHSVSIPENVGSFAEFATALHLSGLASADDLSAMYVEAPPGNGSNGTWVNRTTTFSTTSLDDELFVATIAADVLELVDGAYEAAGIQYYEITISTDGARPVVVSGPARVPAPAGAPMPRTASFGDTVPPDQAAALAAFFDAYLAGEGELARYVAATGQIPAFPQHPYAGVTVSAMSADSLGRVKVQLEATTVAGSRHALEYVVDLTFEAGVWEVAGLGSSMTEGR